MDIDLSMINRGNSNITMIKMRPKNKSKEKLHILKRKYKEYSYANK